MRLDRITVSNFKGLLAAEFEPSNFGCLVGENNAGKSSVLQAIVYGLSRQPQLAPALFYDSERPVEFKLRFSGIYEPHLRRLAEEHRQKISTILIGDSLTLTVRYRLGEKVETVVERLVPREERFRQENIDLLLTGKKGAAVREAILATLPEFSGDLPDPLNITAAKAHIASCVRQLPVEQLVPVEGPLPSGIPTSISALLPEAIYIPAVKNLSDDLKTNQSTSFGRLLGLLLDDMTPDLKSVNDSLAVLNELFNRTIEGGQEVDKRHDKVRQLEALVETLLTETFPKVKLEIRVPPPELKAILNSAQILVDDGSRDLIDNKGDGIKRSLTFALLQAYVHHLAKKQTTDDPNAPAQRPLIFLFEEPELYLHPRSQWILFRTLSRIADSHQVVVTTHSPIFFAPGATASFVRVAKKNATPKPVGVLHRVNFSLNDVNADVFRLARFENADAAFFCQRVVLFEGESDDAYCKHLSKMLSPHWDFEQKNVALVRVSGKGNFAKFRSFFEAFGIDVKIVADLDALFEGYQHLGASEDCTNPRNQALQEIDGHIRRAGIGAEPSSRQIKDRVQQGAWKTKYQAAKDALRNMQAAQAIIPGAIDAIDSLFTWEENIARVRACREVPEAALAIVPLLDRLRTQGICILSRGAIEDYYPDGAHIGGSKPERALGAIRLVRNAAEAAGVSSPLTPGRACELNQVFEEIFQGL